MSERDQPTINVSVPDADLRAFARKQADAFFGKNVSRYFVSLLEADQEEGFTERRVLVALGIEQSERAIA